LKHSENKLPAAEIPVPLTRKDRKFLRNQRMIVEAAEQVFCRMGYRDTGISDIADAADLGYGTIYRYFSNKQDILSEIVKEVGEEIYNNSNTISKEKLHRKRIKASFSGFIDSYSKHSGILKVWREAALADKQFAALWDEFQNRVISRAQHDIARRRKDGQCINVNSEIAGYIVINMLEAASEYYDSANNTRAKNEILDTAVLLWYRALYYPAATFEDKIVQQGSKSLQENR
jgi:AcrR family transcriptional regulator